MQEGRWRGFQKRLTSGCKRLRIKLTSSSWTIQTWEAVVRVALEATHEQTCRAHTPAAATRDKAAGAHSFQMNTGRVVVRQRAERVTAGGEVSAFQWQEEVEHGSTLNEQRRGVVLNTSSFVKIMGNSINTVIDSACFSSAVSYFFLVWHNIFGFLFVLYVFLNALKNINNNINLHIWKISFFYIL